MPSVPGIRMRLQAGEGGEGGGEGGLRGIIRGSSGGGLKLGSMNNYICPTYQLLSPDSIVQMCKCSNMSENCIEQDGWIVQETLTIEMFLRDVRLFARIVRC